MLFTGINVLNNLNSAYTSINNRVQTNMNINNKTKIIPTSSANAVRALNPFFADYVN